eukprot:13393132-Alexandrium_andersonii.AAC.1
MRAHPRPRLRMSSGFAQGRRCRSEHREGCCSTSAQGETPWVALDLMDFFFFADPQSPEGPTSFDSLPLDVVEDEE